MAVELRRLGSQLTIMRAQANTVSHSKSYLPCLTDREEYSSPVWSEVCQPKRIHIHTVCIAIGRHL